MQGKGGPFPYGCNDLVGFDVRATACVPFEKPPLGMRQPFWNRVWLKKRLPFLDSLLLDELLAYMNNAGNKETESLNIAQMLPPNMMSGQAIQRHSTSNTIKTIAQTGNLSFLAGCAGVAGVPT